MRITHYLIIRKVLTSQIVYIFKKLKNHCMPHHNFNPLNANSTKWSNTVKHFSANIFHCLSVFDYFVGLACKRLRYE